MANLEFLIPVWGGLQDIESQALDDQLLEPAPVPSSQVPSRVPAQAQGHNTQACSSLALLLYTPPVHPHPVGPVAQRLCKCQADVQLVLRKVVAIMGMGKGRDICRQT